jgi:hypothetical protein
MKRALAIALLLAPLIARADPPKPADGSRPTRVQTLTFDDDAVEGDLTRPDGEYVQARKRVKHTNLIKIREEFRDKLLRSAGQL